MHTKLVSFIAFQAGWQLFLSFFPFHLVQALPSATLNKVPAGFEDQPVGLIDDAADLHFLPQRAGKPTPLLVTQKSGQIYIFPDPEKSSARQLVADLSARLCTNDARGLKTILPHLDYWNNNWVYLFYTYNANKNCGNGGYPHNRVARFKMDPVTYLFNITSEQVYYESTGLADTAVHEGGCLMWGDDGNLFNTHGEGGYHEVTAQNWSSLMGSAIRLTPENGIPADNPYTGTNTVRCPNGAAPTGKTCQEIYAKGLRNPYGCMKDPNVPNRMLFQDVGSSLWEEINELLPGKNYGWPINEGPCSYAVSKSKPNCTVAAVSKLANAQDPIHYYYHDDAKGGAIVGAAIVPLNLWPAPYSNTTLMIDYVHDTLYHLVYDTSVGCRTCATPKSYYRMDLFFGYDRITQLRFGPYKGSQAMYYVSRAGGNGVRRLVYTQSTHQAPVASFIVANTPPILPGTSVLFDASLSSDPAQAALSYLWDFGDGSAPVSTTAKTITHSYGTSNQYTVQLTVTNAYALTNVASKTVQIGAPPTVQMISPVVGSMFSVGDIFLMLASGSDSNGNPLPPSAFTWEIHRHHELHYHQQITPTVGNNFNSAPAPEPEDFAAAATSYLEFLVTGTDSIGLSTTVSRNVMPNTLNVTFASVPPGITLEINGATLFTPETGLVWVNQPLDIKAPDVPGYSFVSWSDGGAQSHTTTVAANATSFTINYTPTQAGSLTPFMYINCGSTTNYIGTGNKTWVNDTGLFGTGTTSKSTTGKISNTTDQGLMQTWRADSSTSTTSPNMTYNIQVPTGQYQFQFLFMENTNTAPNLRVFSIYIENYLVFKSIDIFALTGGTRRTLVKQTITPIPVTDGFATIVFVDEIGAAVVNAMAVFSTTPPSTKPTLAPISSPATAKPTLKPTLKPATAKPTLKPTLKPATAKPTLKPATAKPTPKATFKPSMAPQSASGPTSYPASTWSPLLYIDCGSTTNYQDGSGKVWINDTGLFGTGTQVGSTTSTLFSTTEQNLMRTFRKDASSTAPDMTYTIPVPASGQYQFQFWFFEPSNTAPGQRVFSVFIEGIKVLSDVDPFALSGAINTVVMLPTSLPVTVSDGFATIEFGRKMGNPVVSAIAIFKFTPTG